MPTTVEWNDLSVLLAVCRTGSLSGAARALGQNHSTIFRRVNAIEAKTGVRFFERLASGYAMTDAGRTALRYAERVESEVHAFGREILGQDLRLQGRVAVTAPEGLATMHLPALLSRFREQHPAVHLDVLGGAAATDLARREADIAIRATRKPPDASLGRRVCPFRFAVYTAPAYLARHPNTPLPEHDFCLIDGILDWLVPLIWKKKEQGKERTVFSGDSSFSVIGAVAAGMGVTILPCYLGDRDERLVRATEPIERLTLELWILTHPDLRHTARVKALMAFLYDALEGERDLFEGKQPERAAKRLIELRG